MPKSAQQLTIRAPAKLNLTLEVLGRRPDGYHELHTIFQAVTLYDVLEVLPAADIELVVDGEAPHGEDNLILRAARALARYAPAHGARLLLHKLIPSGAGLGGGSSDAAAALVLLNRQWETGLSRSELAQLAQSLGADVPFFLWSGVALGTGRGDDIRPLELYTDAGGSHLGPPIHFVLSTPPFHLPDKTAQIFQRVREENYSNGSVTRALVGRLAAGEELRQEDLHNALLGPACAAFEPLAEYLETLQDLSGHSWTLSGAGPTCFTLAATQDDASRIASQVSALPGRRFVCHAAPPLASAHPELLPLPSPA